MQDRLPSLHIRGMGCSPGHLELPEVKATLMLLRLMLLVLECHLPREPFILVGWTVQGERKAVQSQRLNFSPLLSV